MPNTFRFSLLARIGFCIILLALPYYIFYPQHFIGGDDSRIFTIFPRLFLEQIAPYSWFHFSAVGNNNPSQFFIPLTTLIYLTQLIIPMETAVSYLFFSLPFIMGFLYFERLVIELLGSDSRTEAQVGSLLYIATPIILVTQWSVFLTSVWLIGLIPALAFHYLRYVLHKEGIHLLIASILSLLLSVTLFSIPWILGYLIPLGLCIVLASAFGILSIRSIGFWKRTLAFICCILISQSFWLLPFIHAVFSNSPNSIGKSIISAEIRNTFSSTVQATAIGTVTRPLLGLFHHQIAESFNWSQAKVFTQYYDRLAWANIIFPALILFGLYRSKRVLSRTQRIMFLSIMASFLASLYFFTVNIGGLKHIFLQLGAIPGWVMFRNSYDKFAPGYVFYFSLIIVFSLVIVKNSFKRYHTLLGFILLVIILNALPLPQLVDKPLWTAEQIKTSTRIPDEYITFMQTVKKTVPSTTNILSLPLKNTGYSIIQAPNSQHAYIGQSLVEVFSSRYDISGFFSFPPAYRNIVQDSIHARDYQTLRTILNQLNIGYVLTTEYISPDIQKSYLFDPTILAIQQEPSFKEELLGELVAKSSEGNFHLYRFKTPSNSIVELPKNILFSPNGNILTKKILPFISEHSTLLPLDNTPIKSIGKNIYFPTIQSATNLSPGSYVLSGDNVSTGVVEYNEKTRSLEQSNDITYSLNPEQFSHPQTWKTLMEDIAPTDIIVIQGMLREAKNISNLPVAEGTVISVLEREDTNILPSTEEIFKTWSHGDCNAITSETRIRIAYNEDILTLQSELNHDGCIYTTITLEKEKSYVLEFDYRGTGTGKIAYITMAHQNSLTLSKQPSSEWKRGEIHFVTKHSEPASIYLYSGSDEHTAIRNFRNIQLSPYTQRTEVIVSNIPREETIFTLKEPATFSLLPPEKDVSLQSLDKWMRGDCAAVDTKQAVSFLPTQEDGIRLQSTDGHNACIYTSFQTDPYAVYRLTLDAYTGTEDSISIAVASDKHTNTYTIPIPTPNNQWHTLTTEFQIPENSTSTILYLYSGNSLSGMSKSEYKNVKLVSYPREYTNVTIDQQPTTTYKLPKNAVLSVEKLSPVAYRVHGENLPKSFLLQFKESFNTGWHIYPEKVYAWHIPLTQKPISSMHYVANGINNAWWLDKENICTPSNCSSNTSTYSVDFLILFAPQRWFYVGTAITIGFIVIVTIYGIYSYYNIRHETSI